MEAGSFGDYRTLNSPGISPSAGEIAAAVCGCGAQGLGKIHFQPDPTVERIVTAWPKYMESERANRLGLFGDPSIAAIVQGYRSSLGS